MRVIDAFTQTFVAHGYEESSPAPVFPCPDPSTLFTCASISIFKPRLLNDSLKKAYVLQPCLRVQNLKYVLEEKFDPEYLSSFQMLGTIASSKEFDSMPVVEFFNLLPHLKNRVLLRSSRAIAHPAFAPLEENFKTEYDTRNASYYQWHYGDKSLHGKGVTFALQQSDGAYADIGNLVAIFRDHSYVAAEFGFGIETYNAREGGLTTPYAASAEFQRMKLGFSAAEKRLGDTLIVSETLCRAGVRPGRGREASVLRKALRNACFLALRMYGPEAEERLFNLSMLLVEDSESVLLPELRTMFCNVQESLNAFRHASEHIRKHAPSGAHAGMKIERYRLRYGIPKNL